MLSTAAMPMQPSRFWQTLTSIFSASGHGSATYTVGEDRQLIHDQTQLSFVIGAKESAESFIDRVRGYGEVGDVIEFSMRGGQLASAKITRRADVPLRMESHETLDAFAARIKHLKATGTMPQA